MRNYVLLTLHSQNLPILPALLRTAVLSLLSASIPLVETMTSVLLALTSNGREHSILRNPTLAELQTASSIHVLGFTSHGELLVAESEGSFAIDEWDRVYGVAKRLCCDDVETASDDGAMQDEISDENGSEAAFLKSVVKEKVEAELYWKE